MYSSLIDAPVHADLVIVEVLRPELAQWLNRLGLFTGGHIVLNDEEIAYHPVRVRGDKGDVIIPAGLGLKILVHTENDARIPLVEMQRKEKGHVEALSCGRGCIQALEQLGIRKDTNLTLIRSLPHMDYITIISRKVRTRLSEGEAARIWGRCEGGDETQFYFAPQNKPFDVLSLIGGRKIQNHLATHGIQPGCTLVLERIEQTRELHAPGVKPIAVTSAGGLRLYLSPSQAERIIVKAVARQENSGQSADSYKKKSEKKKGNRL